MLRLCAHPLCQILGGLKPTLGAKVGRCEMHDNSKISALRVIDAPIPKSARMPLLPKRRQQFLVPRTIQGNERNAELG